MIRFYLSSVTEFAGNVRPSANVTVASRTEIRYNDDKSLAGVMAEVTDEQNSSIIESGGVETTREELAYIYLFPASFSSPPNF